MDTNICLFHASEVRTMAFRGSVKLERCLKLVDNMTRNVVFHAIRECTFDYEFTWCTNNDIIGAFIGCLARARIDKWAMIYLCCNIFYPVWCVGLEEVVKSINEKLRISLPKMYMAHPSGSFDLAVVIRRPTTVI